MFFLLFLFWIGFNGAVTLEIVLFGVVISALLCLFCSKAMGYSFKQERRVYRMIPSIFKFLGVLIVEIVKANLSVARVILSPQMKIEPTMTDFTPDIGETIYLVALANAITLTPGTITYRLEHGEICAHCLDYSMAEGIDDSPFVRQIMAMEAKSNS